MKYLINYLILLSAMSGFAQNTENQLSTVEKNIEMEDLKVYMLTTDGNVTVEFDADTEDVLVITNAKKKRNSGKFYINAIQDYKKVDKDDLKNLPNEYPANVLYHESYGNKIALSWSIQPIE